MFENEDELMDLFGNIGIEGLEKSKAVLDEAALNMEMEKIIEGAIKDGTKGIEAKTAQIIDRIEIDRMKIYKAGFLDGVRLYKWISRL